MQAGNSSLARTGGAAADDRILGTTRGLALFIIPFLVVASVILYVWPNDTGRLFAWPIKPPMTAMMLSAAYAGGIYFFVRVAVGRQWHAVKVGFLPVTVFATLLGIATLLHWDRFSHGRLAFWVWAALYFTTPFLVLGAWLHNRPADPGTPAAGEVTLPLAARRLLGGAGFATLLAALLLYLAPGLMIAAWPWSLTPLTARVMGAMFALPGVVGLQIAFDSRWSAARVILEAQAFSLALILIAGLRSWGSFNRGYAGLWILFAALFGFLAGIAVLYLSMQARQL